MTNSTPRLVWATVFVWLTTFTVLFAAVTPAQALSMHSRSTLYASVPSVSSKTLPYVVGLNGVAAQKILKKAGYDSQLKDASAFKRKIDLPSSWIVAEQPEAPASKKKKITLLMTYRSDPSDVREKDASSADFYDEIVVPNFVGMPLNEANDLADTLHFNLEAEDETQGRGIWNSSNWVVNTQSIEPGRGQGTNTYIDVTVIKKGETSTLPKPLDQHIGEMQFFGRVTGYQTEWTSNTTDLGIIIIDGAVLSLDLIWPTDASCISDISTDAAIKAKEKLFPVGTKVNVIRGNPEHTEDAFVTVRNRFDPYQPFDNSGNEKLVTTGYWVPFGMGINANEVPYNPAVNYAIQDEYLTPVQHEFALQILDAGNAAKAARAGDTGTCLDQAAAYQAKIIADKQALDELMRQHQESGVYGNSGTTSGGSGSSSGSGYVVMCRDGSISQSGGRRGACSHHGGVAG